MPGALGTRASRWLEHGCLSGRAPHEGLPEIYGEAPAAVAAARDYFRRQAGVLAQALDDGRAFLLGDAFQVADLLVVSCLTWARFIGIELLPVLAAYEARASARPAFAQAMAANFPPAVVELMQRAAQTRESA